MYATTVSVPALSIVQSSERIALSKESIDVEPMSLRKFAGFSDAGSAITIHRLVKPAMGHAAVEIVVSDSGSKLFSVYWVAGSPVWIATSLGLNGAGPLADVVKAGLSAAQEAIATLDSSPEIGEDYWAIYQVDQAICSGKYGDPLTSY